MSTTVWIPGCMVRWRGRERGLGVSRLREDLPPALSAPTTTKTCAFTAFKHSDALCLT